MAESGVWVYDPKLDKVVKVSDRIPRLASRVLVGGEHVYCKPNGETLDFGTGPIRVNSAAEKRRVLREHGVAPAPDGTRGIRQRKYDPDSVPTFEEHFNREHGVPLKEAHGLVHIRES